MSALENRRERIGEYQYFEECLVSIKSPPEKVFAYVDDQEKLGAHMDKPSLMMLGGRMTYQLDENRGRAVGSVIRMEGRWPGLTLGVEEIITRREPPRRKIWQTRGAPNLIVIGPYEMGFDIAPDAKESQLRVYIRWAPPKRGGTLLSKAFGPMYARWCIKRMAEDAAQAFRDGGSDAVGLGPD